MPFKSENQRRYLWMRHPKIARKWAGEEKSMPGDENVPPYMKGRGKKKNDSEERMNAISRRLQKTMDKKGDKKAKSGY